jgi:D-alanyl-D-alanine carboxypeptidase/D-alanyl-D-alanine-endopeptidase (penicillin-binding protein 4)
MFPRSFAFSTALAVLASSLLQPSAAAGKESQRQLDRRTTGLANTAHLTRPVPSQAIAPTAWQQRIAERLHALRHTEERTTASTSGPAQGLVTALERVATSMDANVSIAVKDLRTGEAVFEHHAEAMLNPASNHKLLTATAAVTLLGEDYRFETRVLRDGADLILVGGGDPSLQVEDVQALAASVDTRGLERIVVDDSLFSDQRFGPGYDHGGPGFSYMAPSGALSLQYNTVVVRVRADDSPSGIDVQLDPPCPHVLVERGAPRGPVQVTTRERGKHTIVRVDGRPGAPVRIRRRIADPSRFTASVFAEALGAPELPVVRGLAPRGATEVAVHRSAPLPEVLGSALKFSNNFTTEQVLRTLGHHASDRPGDWDNGAEVLRAFWDATGQDPTTLAFENASGLSARGRVTPRALVDLVSLWAHNDDAEAVLGALPVAGREGTLRGRLRRTAGRVRAKTGTLSNATGLTGIVHDRAGEPRYAFSVLVGSERVGQAKRLQDRVVMALVQH